MKSSKFKGIGAKVFLASLASKSSVSNMVKLDSSFSRLNAIVGEDMRSKDKINNLILKYREKSAQSIECYPGDNIVINKVCEYSAYGHSIDDAIEATEQWIKENEIMEQEQDNSISLEDMIKEIKSLPLPKNLQVNEESDLCVSKATLKDYKNHLLIEQEQEQKQLQELDKPVGSIITIKGKDCIVINRKHELSGCRGCILSNQADKESCNKYACSEFIRDDRTSVVFKEIK